MADLPPSAPQAPRRAQWKRNPGALWIYIAFGAGRIIVTGIGLALARVGRGR